MMRIFTLVVLFLGCVITPGLAPFSGIVLADENDTFSRNYEQQLDQVRRMRDDLQRLIDSTTASMQEASGIDLNKITVESLRKPFIEFRGKIQEVIDRLNDQSDFSSALDSVTTATSRALAWWRRQPEEDDQKRIVGELQASLQRLEEAERSRLQIRDGARKQLNTMMSKQLQMERIARTETLIAASRQITEVLAGVRELAGALEKLASFSRRPGT